MIDFELSGLVIDFPASMLDALLAPFVQQRKLPAA
jgi:hypothetical protein